ncbi:hypothetical protein D3C86_1082990 [compost metagenome]
MASLLHYAPSQVSVTIFGAYQLEGFSDSTFINITKNSKPFDSQRAMNGEVARIYRKDERYIVEVTLAQSSVSNNVLMAIYNIDTATGLGKFPLMIRDGSGTTNFFALTSWIADIPQASFSNGMETRTWQFECSEVSYGLGGNGSETDIENVLSQSSALLSLLKQFGVF